MGALHEGHLQLIKESKKICKLTICSIFVNPTQFNNTADLSNYPRTIKSDLSQLKKINCDVVYAPSIDDLYIPGEQAKNYDFGSLSRVMEANSRPGHFNGVATIVEKLFTIINPTKAFFGEKDLQQLKFIERLVAEKKIDVKVVSIPTVREKNGLAKSSRNQLLSIKDQQNATLIYKCLQYCKKNRKQGIKKLKEYVKNRIYDNKNFELEYIEFVDLESLQPIEKWNVKNRNAICIALYISGVRLIDNIIL